ncbi:MAG: DUF3990 domain-containing protein [Bacteroidales bacterium]|nr:DUF3990 domain-containing protein [Bacteroidales bacterium]
MKIEVYHGSVAKVEMPICHIGRENLDFGRGFYLTDIREQAVRWAINVSRRQRMPAVVNRYLLDRQAILAEAKCKIFEAYDAEWLEFIVASRRGLNPAAVYDYIEGGVANDRVVDTVNLYMAGLMEVETALRRLAMHRPNNQICLLNQSLTDKYLSYEGVDAVE